jgi:hypothetical protein
MDCILLLNVCVDIMALGYMAVTLHFISNSWEMTSVLIGFIRVLYPHTGERLAAALFGCVSDMLPELYKQVWAITADNASTNPVMVRFYNQLVREHSNMLLETSIPNSAEEYLSDTSVAVDLEAREPPMDVVLIRCFAHVIQIAVKDGLQKVPATDAAIGRMRDVIKKISDSPKLLEAFIDIRNSLKCPPVLLQLDVETRWNSTFDMLKGALLLRKPIDELLKRIRERFDGYTNFTISPADYLARPIDIIAWNSIKDFCSFLEPFKDATELMSGSTYPTLGLAVPVFYAIQTHVQNATLCTDGFRSSHSKEFAKAVKTKLDDYEENMINTHAVISSVLDPRVKGSLQNCGVDIESVKTEVIKVYEEEYKAASVFFV